jgi:hypothetical protein
MATAGITHDVVLDGVGYMLAQGKGGATGYSRETLPGYVLPAAAIETDTTESLESPDAFNFGALPVRRVYFDEWRGSGRYFWRGGGAGDTRGVLSAPREGGALEVVTGTGGYGGLVAELRNLRPLLGGVGLGLTPGEEVFSGGSAATSFAAIEYGGTLYLAQDDQVYSLTVDGSGNFSGLTTVGTLTANAVSAGYDASGKAWFCGADGTIRRADNPTTSYGTSKAADFIAGYGGVTFRAWQYLGNNSLFMDLPGGVLERFFSGPIHALCVHLGALWIGCADGLYRLEGTLEPGNPSTNPALYDVFRYTLQKVIEHPAGDQNWRGLTSFDGALWGELAGRLVRVTVGAGGFSYKVQEQPIPAGRVWSLAVGAGCLLVSLQSILSETVSTGLWAYDPAVKGWWALDSGTNLTYLFSGGSAVRNGQLMACRQGEAALSRWAFDATNPSGFNRFNFQEAGAENWLPGVGQVTLPFIAAGDLAEVSQNKMGLVKLLRVGVEWDTLQGVAGWDGWPSLTGLTGQLGFGLKLSLDNGQSWLYLQNALGTDLYYPATNLLHGRTDWKLSESQGLIKPISQIGQGAPAETDQNGNGWLLALVVLGGPGPLVRRVWLDYQVLEFNQQIGTRWKLALDLENSPEALRLDGQPDEDVPAINFFGHIFSGADAKVFRLWQLWQTGATVDFYDLDGFGSHKVKVVGIKQERAAPGRFPALPGDGGTLQQNWLVQVELVEVIE